MEEPVLDLATLIERPRIKIDDSLYEILSPDELSVLDHQRFAAWGRHIDALMAKPRLTKAEKAELSRVLRQLGDRIMVGVPEEVRAKLSGTHRLAVAEVFTALPLARRLNALVAGATLRQAQGQSTGAKPRRGSKGSTAGRRAGGSAKRRSPSSART